MYQIETLIHVGWFGHAGIKTPYTLKTLEDDLKREDDKKKSMKQTMYLEILQLITKEKMEVVE